jgi:SAM-dependent methyltransferase
MDEAVAFVEHERIAFPSFPYEWPPEMLHAAGELTLDLAENLLAEGLGLKDATPYNVLFRGTNPVFVDLLSFERRDAGDPTWLAYAQFVRTFLLPLLVNKTFALPLRQLLTTNRDGLQPEDVNRMCGAWQKLKPPFLTLVALPSLLSARHQRDATDIYQKRRMADASKARFILEQQFKSLRRSLDKVTNKHERRRTPWSNYMTTERHFSERYLEEKRAFVAEALGAQRPRRVLDVGCNTGYFSLVTAEHGAEVVAVDSDEAVVGEVWKQARAAGADVLPLVVDITRPSAALGWRNRESPSFLERARGSFDAVLMLAVSHHMLVTERIPLAEIIELAAELTTDALLVEFVPPDDPMFRTLARGRDQLFEYLTNDFFESACRKRFDIARSHQLADSRRTLYLLRKKESAR